MPSYLTPAGFSAPRGSDFYQRFVDDINASGTGPWDFSYDEPLGQVVAEQSVLLGEVSEGLQAVYDSRIVDNAVGIALDDLCAVVNVYRLDAYAGSVTLRLYGTAGTVIPAGKTAQGGGLDGLTLWAISDTATIGVGGYVDATAVATETGALAAPIGSITTIDTPVSGWTSVDNLAAAAAGSGIETDAELRVRRKISMKNTGGQSVQAIGAALYAIDGVQGAIVVDNYTTASTVIQGVTLDQKSIAAILYPASLTADQIEQVATVLAKQGVGGIEQMGSETATITDSRTGVSRSVYWDYASSKSVTTDITVVLAAGYVLSDVQQPIIDAITEHIDAIELSHPYYLLDVYSIIGAVDGVTGATVLLDGSSANVTADLNEQITAGAISVTL